MKKFRDEFKPLKWYIAYGLCAFFELLMLWWALLGVYFWQLNAREAFTDLVKILVSSSAIVAFFKVAKLYFKKIILWE